MLKEDERIDQVKLDGVKIIQSKDVFAFSLDALLLANFPSIPKRGTIVDLCAGTGAVGLFARERQPETKAKFIEIEIQPRLADMTKRSIELNEFDNFEVLNIDGNDATKYIKKDSVDLLLCNPPYFKVNEKSPVNESEHHLIARHEVKFTLEQIIKTSADLLKMKGKFAMVHRPERLLEILEEMKSNNIAPKRIQFVYPKQNKDANILLIEGIKHGQTAGLKILPPLYMHDEEGEYTKEMKEKFYQRYE
ncbi:MAG: tRNA1(Val) (adenine(37)-N6)-methyltransferase [Lactobacillales bacterium]|jgi:tRNA1(Val) A37 N6-methylase TrmN6|nr:tRNA1(Val) (adenine(37)-N6)-methyltransferase [Lactobacillales bacterium]